MHIETFVDADVLAHIIVERIKRACVSAIKESGEFHVELAGGTTPKRCYELLAKDDVDCNKMHIYFGDERCLPVGHAERNDSMAKAAWLDHVAIPASQIHCIAADLGAIEGAASYAHTLKHAPQLDLVLLGLGEDGHTASLFPENKALNMEGFAVTLFDAPKAPAERISMGKDYLNQASDKWFIVSGAGKRDAMIRIMDGDLLPAAQITDAHWLLEECSLPEV